jgi:hypothetical protein
MIDEMARSGVPAVNPFFHETGTPERLSYYYLWYFSAAVMSVLTGASGWETDAAQTWFTALSSLLAVIGFSIWLSNRASAGVFVVAVAATASLRPALEWLFGEATAHALIRWATGFGGWLFQTSWAPQHVASATLVVITGYLIAQLPSRREPFFVLILALVAAAAFQSSVWAGGFALGISSAALGLATAWHLPTPSRVSFLWRAGLAGGVTLLLVMPFLYDQITITAMRDVGWPITIAPLPVVGGAFPEGIGRVVDVPAYWMVYLPIELPASYVAGLLALVALLRNRTLDDSRTLVVKAFAVFTIGSLSCSWLLVGDLGGNNDLAWRSALPAILLLMCFAAAGLAQWTATRSRMLATIGITGIILGMPEGISQARVNISGKPSASEAAFAKSPALWEAVRRHTAAGERIANNPLFLSDITSWPVNMSWALLANRRSCYAGHNLAIPFATVSSARREAIDVLFTRVFSGQAQADDLHQLANRQGCDVAVVTAADGAWTADPFATSGLYRRVESRPGEWRIYRKAAQ